MNQVLRYLDSGLRFQPRTFRMTPETQQLHRDVGCRMICASARYLIVWKYSDTLSILRHFNLSSNFSGKSVLIPAAFRQMYHFNI